MNLLKRSIIPAAGLLAIALSGAAQEAAITSGDVTLNVNRADDGTFYISYAAYGEELNGDAESNPALFIDTNKEFYCRYTSYEKTDDGGICAVAEVAATPSTVKFEVTDIYSSKGNGEFELQRNVKVAELGDNPYTAGFYSSFGIQATETTEITDNEYFIPAVWYRGNFDAAGNLPAGLPVATDDNFYYREDRVTLPVVMTRRKQDGLTITLINKDTKCETTMNDHLGVTVDDGYQFGGIGVTKRKDDVVTTVVTYPGNDTRTGGMGERRHPLQQGFDRHSYKVYYKIGKTEDYATAVEQSWLLAFNLYDPAVYTEDLGAAYDALIATLDKYYMAPPAEATAPGFPWSVNLRDFKVNTDTYELGFVGAQPTAGYALFRAGLEQGNEDWQRAGDKVVTFWATKSLSDLGLPKSRYAAIGGYWDDWAYTSIRQGCNGMAGVLNAWAYAKRNGIERPSWLNACMRFGDWLVDNQNDDGSFYLEYQPFQVVDGRHPAGNTNKYTTTCSLRYLVELYIATGDEQYKETAVKAAEFCYENVHKPYYYVACVIDNPQTIDSESGQQAVNGFLAMYDLTGDAKWLEAAEQAAIYTASWTFMYDVPVETDQTAATDWPRDRSIVGQHIIAIGHSAADLGFAWSSFVYYRLYLITGKEEYLQIARVSAHDSKLSMNLRGELYPGEAEGLQQEAFTVRTSNNPRRTNSVMEALTWNFAAHLDPMMRFKDAFGTCDIEEVEKMPREEVLRMNERYARYQSSDYGQGSSVDDVALCDHFSFDGRTLTARDMDLCRIDLVDLQGRNVFSARTDPEPTVKCVIDDSVGRGMYLLKMTSIAGSVASEKVVIK